MEWETYSKTPEFRSIDTEKQVIKGLKRDERKAEEAAKEAKETKGKLENILEEEKGQIKDTKFAKWFKERGMKKTKRKIEKQEEKEGYQGRRAKRLGEDIKHERQKIKDIYLPNKSKKGNGGRKKYRKRRTKRRTRRKKRGRSKRKSRHKRRRRKKRTKRRR